MRIRSVRHKSLGRLIADGDGRGLDAQTLPKLRRMLSALADTEDVEQLAAFPLWRVHQLTGDRRGTWSRSVSRNDRLTFRIDEDGAITDLDLEDYD